MIIGGAIFVVLGLLCGVGAVAGAKLAGLDATDLAGLGVIFLGLALALHHGAEHRH